MTHYNPQEQGSLELLAQALRHGMDPTQGLSLYQNTQQEAMARQAANQQLRQSIPDMVTSATQLATSGAPQGTVQDAFGNIGGQKVQGALEGAINNLYPQGGPKATSPLYTAPPDPNAPPTPSVDADTITTIQNAVAQNLAAPATVDPTTQAPIPGHPATGAGLHAVRMQLMTQFRAMGYNSEQLQQLYNLIGQTWTAAGGEVGPAPVSETGSTSAGTLPGSGVLNPGSNDPADILAEIAQIKRAQAAGLNAPPSSPLPAYGR